MKGRMAIDIAPVIVSTRVNRSQAVT